MFDDTISDREVPPAGSNRSPIMSVRNLDFWYGEKQALFAVDLDIHRREVLALIGPSGCGKTTLLKCLNRMNDPVPGARMTGQITFDGGDINAEDIDPPVLRRRFGWVAQRPNPFPKSIYDNVAYGPRIHGIVAEGAAMHAHVRECLERAHLWQEVADRLDEPGTSLSGGQQQRLCIARALSVNPDILLMDEPCSSIDPIATAAIERLIDGLRRDYTVIIITHNLEQARRIADRVAFFHLGKLLEVGPMDQVFDAPRCEETAGYLSGTFG